MGRLIQQIMDEQKKDTFFEKLIFDTKMIPELMLLGTLEHKEVPTDDGRMFHMDIIHYDGKQYVMKAEEKDRWFDRP